MNEDFVIGLIYDIYALGVNAWQKEKVLDLLDNVACSLLNCSGSKEDIKTNWKKVYSRLGGDPL